MKKEAKFILDKPKSVEETYIILKYSCKDRVLKYSVGEKILPTDWNPESQRSRKDKKLNFKLEQLSDVVDKYQETCRIFGKDILRDDLKAELNGVTLRKERRVANSNMFGMIDIIIKEMENGSLLTKKGKRYNEKTISNYEKAKRILEEFNSNLTFDEINYDTYNSFIAFCNNKSYSLNYTGTFIKSLKSLMNIANKKKWHKNMIYKEDGFKKLHEDVETIFLNDKEIKLLYDLDLSHDVYRETIRDRYIIDLFTGLRISDMKTLSEENIEEGIISHINKKTKKKVDIPVHPYVSAIIEKYDGKMPKQYNDVAVNREIKVIAKQAGINSIFRYTKTIGGETKIFEKKKWQLITNHTARRSMTTNLLKHVDVFDALPVMGMSLKTLALYNKRSSEENAEMLKTNSFFKKEIS